MSLRPRVEGKIGLRLAMQRMIANCGANVDRRLRGLLLDLNHDGMSWLR
jgi:hypothetical protein